MTKVLVTGMSGLIGGLLRTYLSEVDDYILTALNRSEVPGIHTYQSDISDLESILPAFKGQDVVVHLAANLSSSKFEDLLPTNLIGTYNVYEAARLSGVKRVVFASSGSTIRGFEKIHPYSEIATGNYENVPSEYRKVSHKDIRPADIYGATKVWGEALGRHFSESHDMSILCVRIGSVTKQNKPLETRQQSIYLSHRDACQILKLCIEAPDTLRYDIFFATSDNKWNYRDLEHAKKIIGFIPQDSAESANQQPG